MPELTTAPTETSVADADEFYFNDVSESPDALNRITTANLLGPVVNALRTDATPADARATLEVDPTDNALYIDDFANLQAAFTAFESASERLLLGNPSSQYVITATQTLSNLVNKVVDFRGANVHMTGATTQYAIHMLGTWSNSIIRNAIITGDDAGTQLGILWTSNVNGSSVENCIIDCQWQGIVYQGTGYPQANRISGCRVSGTAHSGVVLEGEYCTVAGCNVYSNSALGIYVPGGNNTIIGSSIAENLGTGIYVEGMSSPNADHGTIANNLINHNHKAGIFVEALDYGMIISGNQIAANDGTNLGSAPQNSSFGIYVKNGTGLQIVGNDFLRNKFSLGIEGINASLINSNVFNGNSALTTRHAYEVGGTNATYLFNGNIVKNNLLTNTVVLATDMPGATLANNLVV